MSLSDFSNPRIVRKNARNIFGPDVQLKVSDRPQKKYMLLNPHTQKWVYFGQMGYEDFTKHKDEKRRENYLKRSAHISGDWKKNKYSPNNLARRLLW
jgi:hypothetical protein